MPSPHYATDLLTRAAAVSPTLVILSGATRNAWHSRERPAEGTPIDSFFAQESGGVANVDTDGELRFARVRMLTRGRTYQATFERAKQLHDALHLSGRFTANGNTYMDCRAEGVGPEHIDFEEGTSHEWFVESFTVWYAA